ncbi:MAG: hypothetical protein Q8N53_19155, partial [Longimicrobiales bacterium]|nr:hypothetical protein [Longimicrobiales bacterium]
MRTRRTCGGSMVPGALALAAAVALAGAGAPVCAQTRPDGGDGWWRAWSPLAPVAELARPPAPAPMFPLLLLAPPLRVGLSWTAGNPAALSGDVAEGYTEFRGGVRDESGAYRRPLDAGRVRSLVASAHGWRPLGPSGGVAGGVTVERATLEDGVPANLGEAYAMSPHLFADSSGSDLGRTLARVEGAGGWALGDWGLGLALGHESWDTRTDVTQVPRSQRGSRSGAAVGATRALASGRLMVGGQARWLSQVQAMSINTRQAETTVYMLEGYGEPVATRLVARQGYSRRVEREGGAAGVSAQIEAAGVRWIAFAEASKLAERQSEQFSNNPPTDRWDARGRALGVAASGGAPDGPSHFVARLTWARVTGEAGRAGLEEEGILFEATESLLDGALDVRLRPAAGWQGGAHLSLVRDDRDRRDRLARVRSSLKSWRPALAVE